MSKGNRSAIQGEMSFTRRIYDKYGISKFLFYTYIHKCELKKISLKS
nr:MAG TPA: hypothetical protein [Caudoviricetes sp.]